jgi:pyruvate-ferredoxin/flavodoxin oxidoreductase
MLHCFCYHSQRGTAQNPDVFMQLVESSNQYYNAVPNIVAEEMAKFAAVVGREYKPYEYYYYGTTAPTLALVCMGSGVKVIQGTLEYLKSEQACLIAVRMFRPWSASMFLEAIPSTVKRVAVLDRTREGGSQGEPLYLDVCTSLMQGGRGDAYVTGGRYGLGSKDFTPRMVKAVLHNLMKKNKTDIQRPFTVGIDDDVTHLSLPLGKPLNTLDGNGCGTSAEENNEKMTQCVFFGFGSDGTVGGNKQAIKIIGNYHEDMKVQAYFEYDAKKSSGWSVSHLRFSPHKEIEAPYRIGDGQANYVACHNESYVQAHKFDVAKFLQKGGTFFLNTTIAAIEDPTKRLAALESLVSPKILRKLAVRNIQFYIMDAGRLATEFGLTGRINMICMCVFFRLSGVLPLDDAIALLKASIRKTYGYKGDNVVQQNLDLLGAVVNNTNNLIKVEIPQEWKSLNLANKKFLSHHIELIDDQKIRKFMTDIVDPISKLEGDGIPVSKFLENHILGGVMIPGTSKYEKRNPNPSKKIPEWQMDSCTQCNLCVFVCPHAAIRPFVVTKEEAANAPFPKSFQTVKAQGAELHGKRYALQISTLDCTGCNACVEVCKFCFAPPCIP